MKCFFSLFLMLSAVLVFGQQSVEIPLYWNSISAINPSTSGLHYKHEGLIHSRLGRHDVLNSTFGLLGIYNTHFNQHGAGVTYRYDRIGFITSSYRLKGSYNYQLVFNDDSKLSFGGAMHFQNHRTEIQYPSQFSGSDPSMNIDVGVAYLRKKIFAGIALNQLGIIDIDSSPYNYQPAPHLYGHFRYLFKLGPSVEIIPQTLMGCDLIGVSFFSEFNLNVAYKNMINIGLVYRTFPAIGANISWTFLDRYSIAYQYEYIELFLGLSNQNSIIEQNHIIQLMMRISD